MNPSLKQKIERIVGRITDVFILEEQGCTSEVSQVITDNGLYILKSAFQERYRRWLMAEAKVLKTMSTEKFIPLPKYFGFLDERDSSHLIMSYEPGITLATALNKAVPSSEKLQLIQSFGKFLNRFHEQYLTETSSERDWLTRQLSVAKECVESGLTSGNSQLLRHLELYKPSPVHQTYVHGDCTISNVLVFDGDVQMFIDVSGMTVGDPRYDETLAIGKFHDEPEYMRAFYEGYTRYKVSKEEIEYFEGLYEFF